MSEKVATVHWDGAGKQGLGAISTETGRAPLDYPYGLGSRFEDDRCGTNPDEILGAAHADCFIMALSFACEKAGFATAVIDTEARVRRVPDGEGFVIDRVALTLDATVPEMDEKRFQEVALAAKREGLSSRVLAGVSEISLRATRRHS